MQSEVKIPSPWTREQPLAGDASDRRYSRIWDANGRSSIFVRYPRTAYGQLKRDLEVREWCADTGFRVPGLVGHDSAAGWAILEDFGPDDAELMLEATPADDRKRQAARLIGPLATLARLQTSDLPAWNPPLAATRMRWELAGFELWFLSHRLGITPSPGVGAWFDELSAEIETHPRRVCHRDYHLNNLFLLANEEVGLIDFQDILIGPDTYDAVSLLGERGMPRLLQADERTDLVNLWADLTAAENGWRARWRLVEIQRGLKALGTFARLTATGASSYEKWIDSLVDDLAPRLEGVEAPSELVNLLLDLSRHRL